MSEKTLKEYLFCSGNRGESIMLSGKVCVCMYVYMRMYVCMCICVCMYVCVYAYVCMYVYTRIFSGNWGKGIIHVSVEKGRKRLAPAEKDDGTCMYACMYVCVYICMREEKDWLPQKRMHGTCMYVCMYVCMCTYLD